ncbi:hypothetical protein D3C77_453720 [compost metagenome]
MILASEVFMSVLGLAKSGCWLDTLSTVLRSSFKMKDGVGEMVRRVRAVEMH